MQYSLPSTSTPETATENEWDRFSAALLALLSNDVLSKSLNLLTWIRASRTEYDSEMIASRYTTYNQRDLLQYTRWAKWHLFVLYINFQKKIESKKSWKFCCCVTSSVIYLTIIEWRLNMIWRIFKPKFLVIRRSQRLRLITTNWGLLILRIIYLKDWKNYRL